ncbi:MAG: phosphate ABC transporter permease family protein, partial [Cucumibacter sp.]
MFGYLLLAIVAFSIVAFFVGRSAGARFVAASGVKPNSLPGYHGAFVAIWVGVPALVLVLFWLALQESLIEGLLVSTLPPSLVSGASSAQIDLLLSEIQNVAVGQIFTQPSPEVTAAAATYVRWREIANWAMVVVALAVMLLGMFVTYGRLAPQFRARHGVERFVKAAMILSSIVAVLVTIGIIASLVFESVEFFQFIPIQEFLFGLRWEPQMAIRADQVAGNGAF